MDVLIEGCIQTCPEHRVEMCSMCMCPDVGTEICTEARMEHGLEGFVERRVGLLTEASLGNRVSMCVETFWEILHRR